MISARELIVNFAAMTDHEFIDKKAFSRKPTHSPLQQRSIGGVVLLASFIIGLITGLLAMGLVEIVGFVVGCINLVFALPFALVTALVYRKMQ